MTDSENCELMVRELEKDIIAAVVSAIAKYPDAEDYFIRINPEDLTVSSIYISDHVCSDEEDSIFDFALLELMIDVNEEDILEHWAPDYSAIHDLAESFRLA